MIELALLIKVGQYIGAGLTLLMVIITGSAGAYLVRREGFRLLRQIESQVNQGVLPTDKVFDGLIILCSGILLITPGLITDVLGFLGLVPAVRRFLKRYLKAKIQDIINQGKVITITSFKSS